MSYLVRNRPSALLRHILAALRAGVPGLVTAVNADLVSEGARYNLPALADVNAQIGTYGQGEALPLPMEGLAYPLVRLTYQGGVVSLETGNRDGSQFVRVWLDCYQDLATLTPLGGAELGEADLIEATVDLAWVVRQALQDPDTGAATASCGVIRFAGLEELPIQLHQINTRTYKTTAAVIRLDILLQQEGRF